MSRIDSAAEVNEDNFKCLREAVCMLPPEPVEELLSNGVCARCIFRIFGLHKEICSCHSVAGRALSETFGKLKEKNSSGSNAIVNDSETIKGFKEDIDICVVCLGILQFVHHDDRGLLAQKVCASDLAAEIADVMKRDGHQIDSFSLEVSLPPTVAENEQAVWLYMKRKFNSKPWFGEKFPLESIATKDYLKLSITSTLETLLDVKSQFSDFRIRLTYTLPDTSAKGQYIHEKNERLKRKKTGDTDVREKYASVYNVEGQELSNNSLNELKDHGIDFITFPLEKVTQCCLLTFRGYRNSIYIGGRYLKYSRNVSQSRWIIDDERMGEASIQEIVGGNILPMCQGDSYKFHAAGREDIDVRMLGTGRPFLVEILNSRKVPSEVLIKDMEIKINSLERKFVRVENLKVLNSQGWELMREGEAEKQKQYAALVWIPRSLTLDDVLAVSSLKDIKILQKTPTRVLHRRSPLEREKVVHWMKIENIAGSSQYFLLHLCTQAGTYIKEFVHGDFGRTHPSIGSILGCRAEIFQLDVTEVKMDCF